MFMMPGKKRERVRDIAAKVVTTNTKRVATPKKVRTGRQDVKTPVRRDVTLRAEALTRGGRLTKAVFKELCEEFPEQNLKKNFVLRQLKWYREERSTGSTMSDLRWSRKRKECGRNVYKFTAEIAQMLININNRHWGALSYKRIAGKLADEGVNVSHTTVRNWCKELGMVRRRRFIKPKLTLSHRVARLSFVLGQLNQRTRKLTDFNNMVHGDEKWFFLMKDGQVCRVFPDKQGQYRMPASPKIFHKSRMPKVMFLAVCAKPRREYGFDGKVGIWSFTLERPAKRSNVKTGTVVGQTMILEDVRVDATAYRQKIICKNGVFDCMRRKLWWFHKDARYKLVGGVRTPDGKLTSSGEWRFEKSRGSQPCPEAGTELLYQHDGARPHTARANERSFATQSKMRGFRIQVLVQPAQSPDVNVDDLAFFHSLQSDVSLVAKETRKDLLEAVERCWDEYPVERMDCVWRALYSSYHGILTTGGSNEYEKHRGSRTKRSEKQADNFNREVPRSTITAAKKKLAELEAQVNAPEAAEAPSSSSDSDE